MQVLIRWSAAREEGMLMPRQRQLALAARGAEQVFWLDFLRDAIFELETLQTQVLCQSESTPEKAAAMRALRIRFEYFDRTPQGFAKHHESA